MKKTLLFIFLINSFIVNSQNHIVKDSSTKETIPYVAIRFPLTNSGFYTDGKGCFGLNKYKTDSIYISCLGYKTLKTKIELLKNTIFLTPQENILDEIVIGNKLNIIKKVGFKKGNTFLVDSTKEPLILGFYASLKTNKNDAFINDILLYFNKKGHTKKKKYQSFIRFSIYSTKNRLPLKPLVEKPILIELNENSKKNITITLIKNSIKLNEKGVFIIVEKIGEVDSNGKIISKKQPLPNLKFSTKKPKGLLDYSTFMFLEGEWKDFSILNMNMNLAVEFILAYEN